MVFELRGLLWKELHRKEQTPVNPEESEVFRGKRHFSIKRSGIIQIPKFTDLTKINVKYPLVEPFAYAHIRWDSLTHQVVYSVIEPKLNVDEDAKYKKIVEGLIELVDVELSKIRNLSAVLKYLEEQVEKVIIEEGLKIDDEEYQKLMYFVYRNFVGVNDLEPLMHDPYIEDIGCDGTRVPVYIVHKQFGSIRTSVIYDDAEYLKDFLVKLAERSGRYISYAEPLLDGTLPDGSRVHASLADDVTTRGPSFSIRKFRERPFTPVDMLESKTISADALAYLWLAIQHGANVLIAGGTATGKTSLLNTLSMFIPPEDKIITIEDTRELNLPHENWLPAVSRAGFGVPGLTGEKYGEITLFDLMKESFRQNPDYVIVGEVRGKEAFVMFQGMSAGHPSMSTMHAGDVESLLRRLITPPIELPPSLIEALNVVIVMSHAKEKGAAARRTKQIVEIENVDASGRAKYTEVYKWDPVGDKVITNRQGNLLKQMAERKGMTVSSLNEELQKRKKILLWMQSRGMKDFREIAGIISSYYKDPKRIDSLVKGEISSSTFPFKVSSEAGVGSIKSIKPIKPIKPIHVSQKSQIKQIAQKPKMSQSEKELLKNTYPFKVMTEKD